MIEIHFNEYTLRSLKEEDADSMSRNANDAEVSKYLRDSFPYPYKKENALQWIKFSLEQNVDLLLGIANKEEVIGGIGAHPNSDVHRFTAEVGFWLGKDYWNKGITSCALRAFRATLSTSCKTSLKLSTPAIVSASRGGRRSSTSNPSTTPKARLSRCSIPNGIRASSASSLRASRKSCTDRCLPSPAARAAS